MITINLRPGVRRKPAATPFAGAGEALAGFRSRVKDPLLLAAVGAWVLVALGLGGYWLAGQRQLATLGPRLAELKAENRRFRTLLAQRRKEETARDSVLQQIAVIRMVDGARYTWPHLLQEVRQALPPYTWLVDLTYLPAVADTTDTLLVEPPVQVQLNGRTMDVQAYTRFLRQLEASPWLKDVTPVSMQTVVEKDRAVTAFTVRLAFERADSTHVRTVPLRQSTR